VADEIVPTVDVDQLAAAVAGNVFRLRKSRNMTQPQLGTAMSAAGVAWDRSIIANVEAGRRQNFTVAELAALAAVFGIRDPWELTKAPSCGRCAGKPPEGFICANCGAGVDCA
jgi:transcriptional regulator with XRE-family HTH domain